MKIPIEHVYRSKVIIFFTHAMLTPVPTELSLPLPYDVVGRDANTGASRGTYLVDGTVAHRRLQVKGYNDKRNLNMSSRLVDVAMHMQTQHTQ